MAQAGPDIEGALEDDVIVCSGTVARVDGQAGDDRIAISGQVTGTVHGGNGRDTIRISGTVRGGPSGDNRDTVDVTGRVIGDLEDGDKDRVHGQGACMGRTNAKRDANHIEITGGPGWTAMSSPALTGTPSLARAMPSAGRGSATGCAAAGRRCATNGGDDYVELRNAQVRGEVLTSKGDDHVTVNGDTDTPAGEADTCIGWPEMGTAAVVLAGDALFFLAVQGLDQAPPPLRTAGVGELTAAVQKLIGGE